MQSSDLNTLILLENKDYIITNKPSGIATLEDRSKNGGVNMLSLVKDYFAAAQVCHRIDKDTSGILVFSKSQEAYKHLSMQFQNRTVQKKYHAVVHGSTQYENFKVDVPLLIKDQGSVKWDTQSGKVSETLFNTLQNFKSYSLLECQPITGRRHQIRVHLKYIDHPIVADTMYGGQNIYLSRIKRRYKQKDLIEHPIIDRMALHARSIVIIGMDGSRIQADADYPRDFSILIKQLKKYA